MELTFWGHRGVLPIRRSARFDLCDDCDLDFLGETVTAGAVELV